MHKTLYGIFQVICDQFFRNAAIKKRYANSELWDRIQLH